MHQHNIVPAGPQDIKDPIERDNAAAYEIYMEDVGDCALAGQREFRVDDESSADWVLNKMAGWRDEIERIKAAAQTRVTRLEKQLQWFERRFGPELEQYAKAMLALQDGKGKKVHMPSGIPLYFRYVAPSLKVYDDTAFKNWVITSLKSAVEYKPEIKKSVVNEYVKQTGDIPPGAAMTEGGDKFYIGL